MREVNEHLINLLGMPKEKFRIDVSAHPFTVGLSTGDVRITTRYEGRDFRSTMFSVIHECGHAIYELQLNSELEFTPVGGAASYSIHESQSRFWENVVGRSQEFTSLIYPYLRSKLQFLSGYDREEIYKYFNLVRPSLIRVDADEITYNFHTAIRYEIEKKLIAGDMDAQEIPAAWEELTEKYLGLRPRNDAEGALQDVHWSGGSFGYFPTYTLGNVIAATLGYKVPHLYERVMEGNFGPLKEFLKEKIHRWGSIYSPKELLRKALGVEYEPEYLVRYLQEKYL